MELCALYNQVGRHQDALDLLSKRNFQPWEGGEGGPLGQHIRSHLALGRGALAGGNPDLARDQFAAAMEAPLNLGEAKHLLTNQSDIYYWLGCACEALGEKERARELWLAAASFKGDFQEMSVRSFSEMTYFSAMASMRLGQKTAGRKLLRDLLAYAQDLEKAPATIDYFATSLPTMLLFDDDLQRRQEINRLVFKGTSPPRFREEGEGENLAKGSSATRPKSCTRGGSPERAVKREPETARPTARRNAVLIHVSNYLFVSLCYYEIYAPPSESYGIGSTRCRSFLW